MLALSPETEALVRAEAVKLGKTEDEVIRNAFAQSRQPLMELPPAPSRSELSDEERRKRIDAILESYRALPVFDNRTADEILGYDENGLFKVPPSGSENPPALAGRDAKAVRLQPLLLSCFCSCCVNILGLLTNTRFSSLGLQAE